MAIFSDKDTGYKEFMNHFKLQVGETAAHVGWLRGEQHKDKPGHSSKEPLTVAQIAAVQEFGSSDGTIPERAPLRSAMAEHEAELKKLTKKCVQKILDGKMNQTQALGLLAQRAQDWIKAKITSNIPPPNAPSTVAAKGSDRTLVDTAQMLNSVEWEIRKGGKK